MAARHDRDELPGSETEPRIRWAPRLRPSLLKRLYDTDAQGIHDLELCDEVGTTLYARCQTYILVAGRQVQCPKCHTIFALSPEDPSICPGEGCDWSSTGERYRESIKNYYAFPGKAMDAFRTFYERYPKARTYQQKILLIDQLIHSFHVSETTGEPAKSVASKLLEGNKKAVVRFLDALSARDPAAKIRWRQDITRTIDSRLVTPDADPKS